MFAGFAEFLLYFVRRLVLFLFSFLFFVTAGGATTAEVFQGRFVFVTAAAVVVFLVGGTPGCVREGLFQCQTQRRHVAVIY